MFPESHCFVAMPVRSCIEDTYLTLLSKFVKGDEIVRPCNRHGNETASLRKHVTKYKYMRVLGNMLRNINTCEWMFDFLRIFENRGIEIALHN